MIFTSDEKNEAAFTIDLKIYTRVKSKISTSVYNLNSSLTQLEGYK